VKAKSIESRIADLERAFLIAQKNQEVINTRLELLRTTVEKTAKILLELRPHVSAAPITGRN